MGQNQIEHVETMKIFASVFASAFAASNLYCIHSGGKTNPNALPNNMCCPFLEQVGINGIPYNAAVHGCCGTQDGVVIEQGSSPLDVNTNEINVDSADFGFGGVTILEWTGRAGDSYNVELIAPVDASDIGGLEGSSATSFLMVDGLEADVEYTIKINTINCMGASSNGVEFKFSKPN